MRVYIRSSEEAMTFISVQLLISVFTVSFFIPLYINKYPPNCVYWVLYWVTKTQTLSLNSETSWGSPKTSNINYGRTVVSVTIEIQRNIYCGLEVKEIVLNWEQLAISKWLVCKVGLGGFVWIDHLEMCGEKYCRVGPQLNTCPLPAECSMK